jgi:hypothetical protein
MSKCSAISSQEQVKFQPDDNDDDDVWFVLDQHA